MKKVPKYKLSHKNVVIETYIPGIQSTIHIHVYMNDKTSEEDVMKRKYQIYL